MWTILSFIAIAQCDTKLRFTPNVSRNQSQLEGDQRENDRIVSLPGLNIEDFADINMYSGYLNITKTKRIHYWFIEVEKPESKPWSLWLNGGPGCSSMEGLLTENGPFNLDINGNLIRNEFGWNNGNVNPEVIIFIRFQYHRCFILNLLLV